MTRIPRHATPDGESIPTLVPSIEALLPFVRIWGDAGYPGLTERQRDEANNARVDVEIALNRMLR